MGMDAECRSITETLSEDEVGVGGLNGDNSM